MTSDQDPEMLQRLQELFLGALDVPVEQREAWLAKQPGVTPELLAQCKAQLELANGGASRIDRLLEPTNIDNPSVIQRIEARGPKVMPILLRDRDESNAPVVRAGDPGKQAAAQKIDQYQVQGEIARGGVGIVLKGHDIDLGRDVAMKVLHEEHATRPDMIQRFIEEAQIGGQLQHPGIVPVYELGLQADERPYFTMKLVKGTTLASQLEERVDPSRDHQRLLSIFAQVCQTMAYAHSRQVLHRDLKPDNVMVGSFGEVQVVDWGLAKVLGRPEHSRASQVPDISVISTVRSGDTGKGSESLTGSIMGTPAYMSPEQARGEVEELDARADVFALGAMLCEILTGKPPYRGEGTRDVLAAAAEANTDDALQRIADANVDEELADIVSQCLCADREQRPRDGKAVSDLVTAYLSRIEERVQDARVRVAATRRTQRMLVAVTAVVLIGFAVSLYFWQEAAEQREIANEQRATAVEQRNIADEQRAQVQARNTELEDIAYAKALNDAAHVIDLGHPDHVEAALDALEPQRRGFAWHWLRARARGVQPRVHSYDPSWETWPWSTADVSPSGDLALTATIVDGAGTFRLHTVPDFDVVFKLPWTSKHAMFDSTGKRVLITEHDGRMTLRDVRTWSELARAEFGSPIGPSIVRAGYFQGFTVNFRSAVAFTADGRMFAGGVDGSLRVFRSTDLSRLPDLPEFENEFADLYTLRMSPDGTTLLLGDRNGRVRLVDSRTGALRRAFKYGAGAGYAVCDAGFSPDGSRVLVTGAGGEVSLWDTGSGDLLRRLAPHLDEGGGQSFGYIARFSPDGRRAITTGSTGGGRIYDTTSWRQVTTLPTASVMATYSEDGSRIVGSGWWDLLAWNARDLTEPRELIPRIGGEVCDIELSADDEYAFIVDYRAIHKIRLRDGAPMFSRLGRDDKPRTASLSPDGRVLAIGCMGRRVTLIDADSGEELSVLKAPRDQPRVEPGKERIGFEQIEFSPDPDSYLLAAAFGTNRFPRQEGFDTPIFLFDVRSGEVRGVLRGHDTTVRAIEFDSTGKRLLSCGYDGRLTVWDVEQESQLWTEKREASFFESVSFSPSGDTLVANFQGLRSMGWLTVRDSATGKVLHEFQGHPGVPISELQFTNEGRRLVSVDRGRTLVVWDTATWQSLLRLELDDASVCRPHRMVVDSRGRRVLVGFMSERRVLTLDTDLENVDTVAREKNLAAMEIFEELFLQQHHDADVIAAIDGMESVDPDVRRRAVEWLDHLTGVPNRWLFRRGDDLRREGEIDAALDLRKQALALRPELPMARWHYAEFLRGSGLDVEAVRAHEHALESDPRLSDSYVGLATLASYRFDREAAMRYVARALEFDPDAKDVQSIGSIHSRFGDRAELMRYVRQRIGIVDDAGARNGLGLVYHKYSDFEQAIEQYEKGLEKDPEFAWLHANLAESLSAVGKHERAIESARRAVAFHEKHHWTLGVCLFGAGRMDEAVASFETIATNPWGLARPTGFESWELFGLALAQLDRVEDAKRKLRELTNAWSLEPYAWQKRAWVLTCGEGMTNADRLEAVRIAQHAVELSNRQGPVMLATLAEAQFRSGDAASAIQTAEEVLTLMNGASVEWLALEEMQQRLARYRDR